MTVLGTLKAASDSIAQGYVGPSSRLNGPITDHTFRNILQGISLSEATTDMQKFLKTSADLALNDKGVWDKLKDFSLATDLVGPGETNIPRPIQNKTILSEISNIESNNNTSNATTNRTIMGSIIEGPSTRSGATTGKII
jgi:hypothetical protein